MNFKSDPGNLIVGNSDSISLGLGVRLCAEGVIYPGGPRKDPDGGMVTPPPVRSSSSSGGLDFPRFLMVRDVEDRKRR
jgi:hypothetical protein